MARIVISEYAAKRLLYDDKYKASSKSVKVGDYYVEVSASDSQLATDVLASVASM